jgi:hypothetical protein
MRNGSPPAKLHSPYTTMKKQITQFKIWVGGSFGGNQISFLHGNRIDIANDNSMNE